MTDPSPSVVVRFVSRHLVPFIQIFALYTVFHGHYGPGGGFQGGATIAASVILIRLALGRRGGQLQFRDALEVPIGTLGVCVYFGTGLVAMLMGGVYLQYSALTLAGWTHAETRSLGILIVETGVAIALSAMLVLIFDNLIRGADRE